MSKFKVLVESCELLAEGSEVLLSLETFLNSIEEVKQKLSSKGATEFFISAFSLHRYDSYVQIMLDGYRLETDEELNSRISKEIAENIEERRVQIRITKERIEHKKYLISEHKNTIFRFGIKEPKLLERLRNEDANSSLYKEFKKQMEKEIIQKFNAERNIEILEKNIEEEKNRLAVLIGDLKKDFLSEKE
jgi:predicted RNase H-like nuclease (RuvC/YqgF family)